jgi:ABC-2 type transport system permease protein
MHFIWISVVKDLRRWRREPFTLVVWLAIPLVLAVLMNVVFGGGGNPAPRGVLLVADEDNTFASKVVAGVFRRDPLDKMLVLESVRREEGRRLIDRGEASAFLVIPAGFAQAVNRGSPFRVRLFTNPSQTILPKVIEDSVSIALDMIGTRRAVGPAIGLDTTVIPEKKRTKSFAALFFPSMLCMAVWMIANALAGEIWKERALGALRRLAVMPVRMAGFLAGKLVSVALVFACVAGTGLVAVRWLGGVPVASLPAAILWLVLAGMAFYLLLLLVSMSASTPRGASMLGNLVMFPLALVGGCFFPFEIMPAWMAAVGRWTPTGWAVTQFSAILEGSAQTAGLAVALAGLVAASALAFLVTLARLRRSFLI